MDTRVRTAVQTMKASPNHDKHNQFLKETEKKKTAAQGNFKRPIVAEEELSRYSSRRRRKIALQQDVDKLKKKLKLEESVHRALERAFTRTLGVLPRLPPYLPSHILELLAEVAVLEEEVVRLEEHVACFRHGLYKEAIYFSSTKINKGSTSCSNLNGNMNLKASEQLKPRLNLEPSEASRIVKPSASTRWSLDSNQKCSSSCTFINGKQTPKKVNSSLSCLRDRQGKENKSLSDSPRNHKPSVPKQASKTGAFALGSKQIIVPTECMVLVKDRDELSALDKVETNELGDPNKLSEDILRCLMNIFLLTESPKNSDDEPETSPTISGSYKCPEAIVFRDPYGIFRMHRRRDIGPCKHFQAVEMSLSCQKLVTPSSILTRRLKILLRKLTQVDLAQLTHQQKLAFWINIYNSCIMNTFLEQGIPTSPEMAVMLMQKAVINVGGNLLHAMTIEHFMMRLPYHSKLVRVYTASQVENELAYQHQNKLASPKLLDFVKDIGSLIHWIYLQLPSELRSDALKCLEMSRTSLIPQPIQVLPYEFRFGYMLVP